MKSVFISSVIGGFEGYRQAAREAVDLMGLRPVMSESFAARPYSSEVACINEVTQSDVYLLILGPAYGFVTDDGISVTHAEFHAARAANRPILAFVQTKLECGRGAVLIHPGDFYYTNPEHFHLETSTNRMKVPVIYHQVKNS